MNHKGHKGHKALIFNDVLFDVSLYLWQYIIFLVLFCPPVLPYGLKALPYSYNISTPFDASLPYCYAP